MAGRRRALIVANGEYDNAGLQRLGSPAADADALAGVLADRAISDFEVSVVRNETAHVVQAEIEDLCLEGKPDDVLLMHFSCHGLKDDAGGLYFAARNTRPDRLRSTAVPADFVQQCIRQSRSRSIVLLLDCCYGGAFGQGVAVRASGDANVLDSFRGGRGRAVITASNSIEYAFEGATLASDQPARPSVFTSALVEGLRTGEADRDEDGLIALGELYEYLFDRVRERNPKQTPSRDIEMQGELYLAKSRRRRIKPSPIPPDLAAAIAAENPFTRLGAVAELRRRLSSPNLPVAMGAFEALRAMASTDIEHVAAAASDALSSAVVRVDVPSVRLSAAAGSSASGTLRVLGPPVAREVRFEAAEPWIGVREVPGGAELAVTAGSSGVRSGQVVVRGPTGDVVVAVEIEALPVVGPEVVAGEAAPAPATAGEAEPARASGPPATGPAATAAATAAAAEPAPVTPERPQASEPPTTAPGTVAAPVAAGEAAPAVPGKVEPARASEPPVTQALASGLPSRPGAVDPVGGFAGVAAVAGSVFAVVGLPLKYRWDSYTLAEYRPGMEYYVWLVAACALLAGLLTLAPRTRARTGPALLVGVGLGALFGLARFVGESVTLSAATAAGPPGTGITLAGFVASDSSGTGLNAGFTFVLLAHIAWVLAGACALVALRRNRAVALGPVRGWAAWAAIGLGVLLGAGWIAQLVELSAYDADSAGRNAAYYVLGALLAVLVPVVAVVLSPRPVGCLVLASGVAGLAGILGPTFAVLVDYSSLTYAGQVIAVSALVLLAVDTAVLARRNQPNGRQA
ncbi:MULTISPECIES: caspase family protein [unclassified Amycolatopsis]|uniref:caspase family protein n=1 Tax=unclassified Amycolatopsis TaxID=2618356 RepID=UPI002876658C|nr:MULTISPECIES: caspase family protein [unclassified Amycolatopsis]MDS0138147.1 caspase family protein [Amycolatopsis sp. 505]MDS0143940.1 caspase family protein [Amycolatopsis sp. CM201R]